MSAHAGVYARHKRGSAYDNGVYHTESTLREVDAAQRGDAYDNGVYHADSTLKEVDAVQRGDAYDTEVSSY